MIVAELAATLGLVPKEAEWAKGDKLIEGMHKALEVFLGVEAVKGVFEMIHGVVELGSALNDTAQKSGLSVEGLQFFGFVAKQNSATMEEMASAVTKYSRGLDEANQKGSGPAAEALTRLGINFHDAGFKANSLDEQVQLISDKLAKLPDGTKKTALAMDLFGRSGASLIPTLNDLGKNGDELRRSFQDLGGGLSGAQVKALDDFGDEMDRAKFSIGALKNQVVAQMIPALHDMVQGFLAWIKANKEMIASTLTSVLHGLIEAVKIVGTVFYYAVEALKFFADHSELTKALLIGLGAVIAAFAIEAAINWVIAFWPLVLAVAVIAAVVLAVRKLWDWIKNGDDIIARTIRNALDGFKKLVDAVVDTARAIKDGLEAAFNWVANLPIIKQLRELIGDLMHFGDKAKGSDEAHEKLKGTAGGDLNDFANNHPWIAKLGGLASESVGGVNPETIRRQAQESMTGTGGRDRDDKPNVTVNHGDTNVTVNGAGGDPDEVAAKVKEAVRDARNEELQSAWDALKGGHS